jgi:hypothetical protein
MTWHWLFCTQGPEAEHYAADVSHDGSKPGHGGRTGHYLLMPTLIWRRTNVTCGTCTRKPSMPIPVLTSRNRIKDECNA